MGSRSAITNRPMADWRSDRRSSITGIPADSCRDAFLRQGAEAAHAHAARMLGGEALLGFQIGLVGLHCGSFAAELELGPRREVLDVVREVIGARQCLAV